MCLRSFYVFRGPPSNRWLWSVISRSSAKLHGSNRDPSQPRLYCLQRAVEHARPPELVLDRGDPGFSGLQDRFHPLLARADRARDRIPLRRVQGRVCRHGSPATEIYAIHRRGIPGRPWSSLLMESLLVRCLVLLLSLALANGNARAVLRMNADHAEPCPEENAHHTGRPRPIITSTVTIMELRAAAIALAALPRSTSRPSPASLRPNSLRKSVPTC